MHQKIAFIDDEPNVLESLKWVFKDEPYQLSTFRCPLEALEKLEENEFAVVVADQIMPEMEGTAFLQQVKQKWPRTECMIMTAHPNLEKIKDSIDQVIVKPWNIVGLKTVVQNAVALYKEKQEKPKTLPYRKKCILYVENEQSMIDIVKMMLERLGYNVVNTTWCAQAIRLLQSRPDHFDLVITDMRMPDMNGLDLSRKLLGIRPDVPIILCTGFSDLDIEERAKEIGIRGIIPKPFFRQDLVMAIRKTLGEQ
ncbi:response regulator [Thermodesulfobacteriota bacterium]